MTEPKPPAKSWESWIDEQIREAQEAATTLAPLDVDDVVREWRRRR
ncbi:MAG TPA: hypothetical protein VGQ77_04455 [Methylomirabilota bacterium]|jgi:hypothetical protein|nr:hypothetical protein [Methylomirabilota bacterium]